MAFCAVCGRETESGARIGDREFCDLHFTRALGSRKRVLLGSLAGVLAACAAAFIGAILSRLGLRIEDGFPAKAAGILLAFLPALVWLFVFYRLDSIEPEPPALVAATFVLGALVAGALGLPILDRLLPRAPLSASGGLLAILDSVLLVGLFQEFLKYLGLRASIFPLQEFDEKIDGIIYGAAIGLGYATMSNLHLVFGSSGMSLEVAGYEFSIACLAQASSSGICGYFLAKAKFEGRAGLMVLLGILAAAALSGAQTALFRAAAYQGLDFVPWRPLLPAALIALGCSGGLFVLIWLENGRAIARASKESSR